MVEVSQSLRNKSMKVDTREILRFKDVKKIEMEYILETT